MKRNESVTPGVNLFPVLALTALTLLGVIGCLVMTWGLHNKIQKPTVTQSVLTADDIGQIQLDKNVVRINLMKRNDSGKLEKSQQIELTLEQFVNSGYPRMKSFMEQMVEKGVITPQE